ncbi:AzlD family protein [Moraxella oblonga]|uniref:AzlD family protein n=1 Tax=Moraxella oblonga TaxID=200413 RepID=UPI00082B0F0A|nr:AzlD family protein [Moraxella oblonga]
MEFSVFITIVALAVCTYLTRIVGYLAFADRKLSPKTMQVMQAVPGCVLISVIAPVILSGNVANMVAVGVTCLAMLRFSLLPTVLIAIITTGVLRQLGY